MLFEPSRIPFAILDESLYIVSSRAEYPTSCLLSKLSLYVIPSEAPTVCHSSLHFVPLIITLTQCCANGKNTQYKTFRTALFRYVFCQVQRCSIKARLGLNSDEFSMQFICARIEPLLHSTLSYLIG
jgi:hypothetical protein